MAKVNQGLEQADGTGYGGSGFKFNEEEDEVRRAAKKAQAKEYGFEEYKSDSEDEDEGIRKVGGEISHQAVLAQAAASKVSAASLSTPLSAAPPIPNGGLPVSLPSVLGLTIPGVPAVVPGTGVPVGGNDGAARAVALAAAMNLQHNLAKIQADAMPEHYEAELEINDLPQNAHWKVTQKETLGPISGLELPSQLEGNIIHLERFQDQEKENFTCSSRALLSNLSRRPKQKSSGCWMISQIKHPRLQVQRNLAGILLSKSESCLSRFCSASSNPLSCTLRAVGAGGVASL
ncbi:RNA helicase [Handroanthus impetiginosus]|uniref:RNA helicase n=1 Tax=Handroanthus impetiginosus TaxID=429701 RepID=A0A2G9HL05_9LAMI|nr:RNA helicase [Handroanthus impetiginosus]